MTMLEQIQNYEDEKAEIVKNVDFENMAIIEDSETDIVEEKKEFSMLAQIMANSQERVTVGRKFVEMERQASRPVLTAYDRRPRSYNSSLEEYYKA